MVYGTEGASVGQMVGSVGMGECGLAPADIEVMEELR